jgi:hypothetical protein
MTAYRAIQIGDVFAVRRPGSPGEGGEALVGRVVSITAIVGPTHGCKLVYLYRAGSGLSRDDLLLPPVLTTRAPWSHRYFEFLRQEPLLPGTFFERHCFRDGRGGFYDEESRPLGAPFDPVAEWKLHEEVDSIEGAIARALGVNC